MADRTDQLAEPADADPFAKIFSGQTVDPDAEDNPFSDIMPKAAAPQTSAVGAFARGAVRGAAPAAGGFAAAGAGAEAGGLVAGLPGAIVGGIGGALLGSTAVARVQDWALHELPESWQDALGLSDRQEKLDESGHPIASFLGAMAPYAVTMRPGMIPSAQLPPNATALQRVLAHPATARVFGGAAVGGMELGQEATENDNVDWRKVAIATGFGVVFNKPTGIGEAITEVGARPARRVLGIPSPTLAQAGDTKVMGPGVTEAVFQGETAQSPSTEASAKQTAREEQTLVGPASNIANVHATARQMEPELFAHYDDLLGTQTALRDWLNEAGPTGPGADVAQAHLTTATAQMDAIAPEVQAAYRRAADAIGSPTVDSAVTPERFKSLAAMVAAREVEGERAPSVAARLPQPSPLPGAPEEEAPPAIVPAAERIRTIEEQRQAIKDDVAQRLVAAGRPEAEAQALGAIVAARYETRAGRFGGALGSAEELYRREAPEIRGVGPPTAATAAAMPPSRLIGGAAIDNSHDVVSGANSSARPGGPVYVDQHIPELSPTLKDANGAPANLHKYLGIHENEEARLMRAGVAYDQAHERATVVERAAVEADGVDWKGYTEEIDGFLSKIEHEKPGNPPPEALHIKPESAIDHHRAANKVVRAGVAAPETAAGEPSRPEATGVAEPHPAPVAPQIEAAAPIRPSVFLARKGLSREQLEAADTRYLNELQAEWNTVTPGGGSLLDYEIEEFLPSQIAADPGRFQFRDDADVRTGVTATKKLRPGFQQTFPLVVWRDLAGNDFIVDGHHRLNYAKELEAAGEQIHISAIVLREADGMSAQAAKDFGKRRNDYRDSTKGARTLGFSPMETAQVQEAIGRNAHPDEIEALPLMARAKQMARELPRTNEQPGYGSDDYRANRVFDFNGERVVGWDNAVARLIERAKSYSTDGPVENGKHAVIVTGPGGAGKSSLVMEPLARALHAAVIDADDAKPAMPEYRGGVGADAVHEESSDLAYGKDGVGQRLAAQGANMIIGKIGHNADSIRAIVADARAAGYQVDLVNLNEVTPEVPYRRRVGRFLRTGRINPEDYGHGLDRFAKSAENYDIYKKEGLFDEQVALDVNGKPQVTDGHDTELAGALGLRAGRPGLAATGDDVHGAIRQAEAPIVSRLPNDVTTFEPQDLSVDPRRFQFKDNTDEAGVSDRLKGVTQWDAVKAGMVLVWQDTHGKSWIVDGHQRLALAKRIAEADPDQRPQLLARTLREADGVTAKDARIIAAMKNIAEGTGTAIDAAKVLRDHPERAGELPPRSELFRQAQGLSGLSPDAFQMVVNGVVPPNYAAIVGRLTPDPKMQEAVLGLLAKTEPANVTQAESVARQGIAAGLAKGEKQESLFGDEDVAQSLYLDRAKVLDRALKDLKRDKTVFGVLSKETQTIEAAGNKLAKEINEQRATQDAQAIQVLQILATRSGPISTALGQAAERARADNNARGAARDFIESVRRMVASGDLARLADGVERGPAHVGNADAASVVEPGAEHVSDRVSAETAEEEKTFFQRARGRDVEADRLAQLMREREVEGQMTLPGAEREGQGTLAQRLANQPLRPTVPQRPTEFGLFGDEARQKELFQEAMGKIRLRPGGRPIITIMREADASTAIHELGHAWLEETMRDAEHPAAPQLLKEDAAAVRQWLGVESSDAIKTRHHEKFARGFEQYMREGVAPSPGLAGAFARFRDWLMQIYQTIKGLGTEISPEIRGVFNRMLAAEPQRTVIAPELQPHPTLADIHETDAREALPTREAEAPGDRALTETGRFINDLPEGIRNAYPDVIAAEAAGPGGPEPAGEAPMGGAARPGVAGGGESAGTAASGGAGGPANRPVVPGGGGAVSEGAPIAGERAERGAALLKDQPLAPEPARTIGPKQSPFLDQAGNIRLDNLTSAEEVRKAIRDAAEANDEFIGDRRGVVTDGQVIDLAADLGVEGSERLVQGWVRGQAYNAEQIMALRKLLVSSATEVAGAMRRAAEGGDEEVMAYAAARDRHQMIQRTVAGATAEAGRALRAFRDISASGQAPANLDLFIRQATGKTLFQLKQEAQLGLAFDSPQQVSKFMNDASQRTFWRMILEYWTNGLISGPATHATYAVGNSILSLERAGPETGVAAAIGALRQLGGRPGERVRIGEVGAQLRAAWNMLPAATKALMQGAVSGQTAIFKGEVPRAVPFQSYAPVLAPMVDEATHWSDAMGYGFGIARGALDALRTGGGLLAAGGVQGAPIIGTRYSHLGAIPDIAFKGVNVLPLGSVVRAPGRMIAAIHSFFHVMNYSMEKNAEAFRIAANEGKVGTAFDERVADIRANPSADQMERWSSGAYEATLMGHGSEFVRQLSRLTNTPILGFPFLKFIDPFVQIGGNIIDQAIVQRSPIGLLSPEIRADVMGKNGNIAQDKATARMLLGTAYAVGFGALAAEGYVSGSGPTDHNQAAMWRLAGNQAHSVKIGDIWYDMHRLGPIGMLLSTSADMYDVAHAATHDDLAQAGAALQHAIVQNILDESFMRGPADLVKAIEEPGRFGEAYVRNFLASFLPFSVGMSQMARASDPYSRQARTIVDRIKQGVPGQSESLYPRRDIWGQPMPNAEALGARGVTAIYERAVSTDPVNIAMLQLGIGPAPVERKIRNIELTDQQYDDFARLAGGMTKMRLDTIVRSPDWQTWPNHIKHDVILETLRQSREAARGVLLMKYPSIAAAATQAQLDKLKD